VWRDIAQVEAIQLLDLHAVVEGGGKHLHISRLQKPCGPAAAHRTDGPFRGPPVMRRRSSRAPGK
jgi:hypothetical protein